MSLFDHFRRPRSVEATPAEVIAWHPRLRARVLGLFIETEPSGVLKLHGGGEERELHVDELPARLGRYEVRGTDDGLLVDLLPLADELFHVAPGATQIACSPVTPWDFRGLALEAPSTVAYADSLHGDRWHARNAPQVVAACYYQFGRDEVRALDDHPERMIHLVVDNELRGIARHSIQTLWDRHRHEIIGISSSPAQQPPWDPSFAEASGFVSTGGYFNMPLALFIDEPVDGPYSLTVSAECGEFRTPPRKIRIIE